MGGGENYPSPTENENRKKKFTDMISTRDGIWEQFTSDSRSPVTQRIENFGKMLVRNETPLFKKSIQRTR